MERTVFTYSKGAVLLVAVVLLFYPFVLLYQLATGTVPVAPSRVVVVALLSVLAWAWIVYLYRSGDLGGLKPNATE